MSSPKEGRKGDGEDAAAAGGGGGPSTSSDWYWSRVSSSQEEDKQQFAPLITLHRLVPRSPPFLKHKHDTTTTTTTHTYKYITPEEIKAAQIKARQEILASKLAPTPTSQPSDAPACSTAPRKKQHIKKDTSTSQPSFPCRLRNGEVGLRRRQLTRLMAQICRTLMDLQNLNDSHKNDFVAPLELEIKKRRWDESARSMRRSLFVLRQEVVCLERRNNQGTRSSQHMRGLAAASRTLNTQLLSLKSQAESIPGDLAWSDVFEEFVGVARRMLVLAAGVGVQMPTASTKWAELPQEKVTPEPQDNNGVESAISLSDVDSTNVHLLDSSYVRNRLAKLASLHLKKRIKQKSPKSTMRERRPRKQDIILEPLKRQMNSKKKTCLEDTTLKKKSHPGSSHFKGSDRTKGVRSAPDNTTTTTHHGFKHLKTNNVGPQPLDSSIKTNHSPSPHSLHTQTSPTYTDNIPASQPQQSPSHNLPTSDTQANTAPSHITNLTPEIKQELSLLLDRVCKLEESRGKTAALISQCSQASPTQTNSTSSLGDAIQRAKVALQTVQGFVIHTTKPSVPNAEVTKPNSIPRSSGLSVKVPKENVIKTSSDGVMSHHLSSREEENVGNDDLERKWLAGESVTEQVRRQKEQFWLSLAKQGYVRPPETLSLIGDEKHCNPQRSNPSESDTVHHKIVSGEKSEEYLSKNFSKNVTMISSPPKKAVVKTQSHQQTQTKSSSKSPSITDPSSKSVSIPDPSSKSASIPDSSSKSSTSIIDPSSKSASITDPSSKSASIIDPSSKSASMPDPSSKSASIKDPSSKSASIPDPSSKSASIIDPSSKSASIPDPSNKSASIIHPSSQTALNTNTPQSSVDNQVDESSCNNNKPSPTSQVQQSVCVDSTSSDKPTTTTTTTTTTTETDTHSFPSYEGVSSPA